MPAVVDQKMELVQPPPPPRFKLNEIGVALKGLVSTEGKDLRDSYQRSEVSSATISWSVQLPSELSKLTYMPIPISEIKALKAGWDGKNAEPFSDVIINAARDVWNRSASLCTITPTVFPGTDNFIVFTWMNKNNRLDLSIYDDEGNLTMDGIAHGSAGKALLSPMDLDLELIDGILRLFQAAR